MPIISKKITDLATINTLGDNDKLLVGTTDDTYNVAYSTILSKVKDGVVPENWGASNVGKYLVVGADGNVTLSTGGGDDEGGDDSALKDVVFYDYDGTVVDSYTATEFVALSAMPPNPLRDGLTAQGWNWSLEDAKTYVAKYKKLNIGQMYVTDDGKTRLYINLADAKTYVYLFLCINGSVDIDWGDGSNHSIQTGTNISNVIYVYHNYSNNAEYTISLNIEGEAGFKYKILDDNKKDIYNETGVQNKILRKVEIGNNVLFIDRDTFRYNHYITHINISHGVTTIGESGFYGAYNLQFIVIPSTCTSVGRWTFGKCFHLLGMILPKQCLSIDNYAFSGCYRLANITVPDGISVLMDGFVQDCFRLEYIIIPDSVLEIKYGVFDNCVSLKEIILPNTISKIGNYVFNNCKSLRRLKLPDFVNDYNCSFSGLNCLDNFDIPNGTISVGLYQCYSIQNVIMPNSVTSIASNGFRDCESLKSIVLSKSLTQIRSQAFYGCRNLLQITIPNSITTIGDYAFNGCVKLEEIHFESQTPPQSASSYVWGNVPTSCIIYVPTGSLSAYTSAANYPDPNTYTYVEE